MLERFDSLVKFKVKAVDREVGRVLDIYFDDRFWTVRYLMIDTGGWLTGKLVLVSPYSVAGIDKAHKHIDTDLTAQQLEASPSPESDLPVSRQFEETYSQYYGYPHYWYGPWAWGAYAVPQVMPTTDELRQEKEWDSHLHSATEVENYVVGAEDGHIGHISDFIIDDSTWTVHYLVVDTRNWWPGKHVLVSPSWATHIDWARRTVSVDLTRDTIEKAPEYRPDEPITRDYEIELCRYYGRMGYWDV